MRYLIIVLLLLGCATENHCPTENVVIYSPYSGYPILIEKGDLSDMSKCTTEEQHNEAVKELRQKLMDEYLKEKDAESERL